MYFDDLSTYRYLNTREVTTPLNIGWLAAEHPFPTQTPDELLLYALFEHCKRYPKEVETRGFHLCELCPLGEIVPPAALSGEIIGLGHAEVRVFGRDGVVYAAPTLVFHYVQTHHYHPPDVFVEAVIYGPRPGSAEYATRHAAQFPRVKPSPRSHRQPQRKRSRPR